MILATGTRKTELRVTIGSGWYNRKVTRELSMKTYHITYRRNNKLNGTGKIVREGERRIFADSAEHALQWFRNHNLDAFDVVVREVNGFSS